LSNTKFYGLTGGIGSGKSTVASIFAKHGVPTLDLDKLGHQIIKRPEIIEQLTATFGTSILDEQQQIHRAQLADIAFSYASHTQQLNHIMHAAIYAEEQKWREKQIHGEGKHPFAIIEASVLIEAGGMNRMHGLIVVLADIALRKKRVLQRGNQSLAQFQAIVQRQCSDEQRQAVATDVFYNNDDLSALEQHVQTWIKQHH